MSDFATTRVDLSGYGTLLATATAVKTGSTVTATVNGKVVTVQVARDLSVSSGDVIIVTRVGAQWFALGRAFTAAPAAVVNPAAPDPQPASRSGQLVVGPVETRSYRTSGWRTDNTSVYQGQYGGWGNHTGCAFYGSGPRGLAGATVTGAAIQVRRDTGGVFAAQASTMRLMTQATRPAGAPTLTSSTAGPNLAVGASTWFPVPTAWVQAMVDGTAGGLAFFIVGGSPYIRFAGTGEWSAAFAMTINWTR